MHHFLASVFLCLFSGFFSVHAFANLDQGQKIATWSHLDVYWHLESETISVSDRSQGEKVVWKSVSFPDMIEGAQAENDIDFARGCFVFKEKKRSKCGKAKFLGLRIDGSRITWSGQLQGCGQNFLFTLSPSPFDYQFQFDLQYLDDQSKHNRIKLNMSSLGASDFYGFGHQYDRVNMRGQKLPIWAMEQGIGRGQQPVSSILQLPGVGGGCQGEWFSTYTAVPFLTSPEGFSFYLENREYLEFDMQTQDRVGVEVWGKNIRGRIITASSLPESLYSLTQVTGRMGDLPSWTQKGLILRASGGSQKVRQLRDTLKRADLPMAALWIEDWVGTRKTSFGHRMWWNWEIDRDLYPDWETLIQELNADDVRVMIYFNPFLSDAKDKKNARRNLFEEAKQSGFLIKNAKGEVYSVGNGGFDAGIVDLSNPGAREFLKDIMREQIALGVSGWMADFGEAVPIDSKNFAGQDPFTFHNEFPLLWASLNKELIDELPQGRDVLYFNRSGNLYSPGQTKAFWLGDQNTTWDDKDGMKTVVPALLSGGLSGYGVDHIDTGGWLSLNFPFVSFRRDKEMFLRWMELGALTALLRVHNTNNPEINWQVDQDSDTLRAVARMSKLFAALAPYRQAVLQETQATGMPLIRHTMLTDLSDKALRNIETQWMLGPDLLFAPVLDKGKHTVAATLPKGLWRHIWSGETYGNTEKSSTVNVDAELGFPALFLQVGSQGEEMVEDSLRRARLLPDR